MADERAFLAAILESPEDDCTKLVYADWLEERGDPRAEYLRLVVQARRQKAVTPEQRRRHQELSTELAELRTRQAEDWRAGHESTPEGGDRQRRVEELEAQLAELSGQLRLQVPTRLRELAAGLDPNWLTVVSDPDVEGCGRSTGRGWQPRFDFVCDRSWADMTPTGDDTVRHCKECGENVHFCDNLADAREHANEGHCIAVDLGVIRREGDLRPPVCFTGRPTKEDVRKTYEEGVDPVSRARLAARRRQAAGKG
jgi:uncharacterized protein (TIGR02996 family)